MSGLAEQKIQDFASLVNDSTSNRDLVETTNINMVDPFFEAMFSLGEQDLYLMEQAVVSFIRLMKTHPVDPSSPAQITPLPFYSHFEAYIDKLAVILSEPPKTVRTEKIKQDYIFQIWCEAVYYLVHSHQQSIIDSLFGHHILALTVAKLANDDYKTSTIMIKSALGILSEMVKMKMADKVIATLDEAKLWDKLKNDENNKEMKSFANELIYDMYQNTEYAEALTKNGLNSEEFVKNVNGYHEELRKELIPASETTGEISGEEDEDYGYGYDDEDEDDGEDEEDDMTAQMEDFFEEIKNKPEMLEAMEIDSSIPDMKDDPLMPKDLPVFSKKFEHLYDEINRQDNLFV
ncbi:hypothetical protein EIN_346680 [Entamoeba invadens IP1]|uniref:Uncharacterized protein n=1 Tax=Entamoeba invadens IP1 TaxID=370355 RepID=L7FJI8_ENTIV|nr:hypothetical protein EIN_346680 [Entamoeba invadens IP1]ELP84021.1 hypothetical protein EIN_346680 [Entamoeba invadens IP1]|eukprot:XP_004183367.1 hypothetical protein EIN_346680 [Entamoeba invadens IP1]